MPDSPAQFKDQVDLAPGVGWWECGGLSDSTVQALWGLSASDSRDGLQVLMTLKG